MRVVIYSRVSTNKQTTENQRLELREVAKRNNWTIVEELNDDGISGSKGRKDRPAFDRLHLMVARKEVDLVMAWSIDRLGRSITEGRLSFAIFSAIAEFERSIIRDRINAGLSRARANGKRLGRPTNVNENTKVAVRLMREKGAPIHRIAKELKIGVGTTQKLLKDAS